jgi:hypothetical protein
MGNIEPVSDISHCIETVARREYENLVRGLSAPFLIIGAPSGIRPLWMMAGTPPIPLTGITKKDFHP